MEQIMSLPVPMNRIVWGIVLGVTSLWLAPSMPADQPDAATEPKPALTPTQQERLKERDRLLMEANKLHNAGKTAEAIVTAEKMLAIERNVFGAVHEDIVES
jgi:hypothetical protein